jgi:hypothetical protein
MEDEDFLAAVEADNVNAPVAEEIVEQPVEAPEQVETPAEPIEAPVEPASPLEPPVVEHKPDPGFVPITVVLDERDKRQKLEQQLALLQAQQQPPAIPDQWEDPEGYAAHQDQKVQAALYQQNLRWSERIAASEHGKETVDQAKSWGIQRCDTDPYFNAKVANSDDPIGFVVSEWKREQIASQVTPDDFAQFQAWKQAQAQIQAPAPSQQAATPTPSRSVPPRSLASAPSAGGVATEPDQSDEEIFAETFSRKT